MGLIHFLSGYLPQTTFFGGWKSKPVQISWKAVMVNVKPKICNCLFAWNCSYWAANHVLPSSVCCSYDSCFCSVPWSPIFARVSNESFPITHIFFPTKCIFLKCSQMCYFLHIFRCSILQQYNLIANLKYNKITDLKTKKISLQMII